VCINVSKSHTYIIYIKPIRILKIQHYNTLLIFLIYIFPERISGTFHGQNMQQPKLGQFNTSEITQAIKICKNALYHDSSSKTIHS
jgi:hypothetical protein